MYTTQCTLHILFIPFFFIGGNHCVTQLTIVDAEFLCPVPAAFGMQIGFPSSASEMGEAGASH